MSTREQERELLAFLVFAIVFGLYVAVFGALMQ
jgi:hypothetical protein